MHVKVNKANKGRTTSDARMHGTRFGVRDGFLFASRMLIARQVAQLGSTANRARTGTFLLKTFRGNLVSQTCGGSLVAAAMTLSFLSRGTRTSIATMSTPEIDRETSLQTLWAEAYDAWIDVPGELGNSVVYAKPFDENIGFDDGSEQRKLEPFPSIVTSSVSFALTSFNRMGLHAELWKNRAANDKLQADLANLKNPEPKTFWKSFGFSKDWREDGFVVAFDLDDADEARAAIVTLARKYEQGAVYEYLPVEKETDVLARKTVPAAMGANVEADVFLLRCEKPNLSLAERRIPDEAYAQES